MKPKKIEENEIPLILELMFNCHEYDFDIFEEKHIIKFNNSQLKIDDKTLSGYILTYLKIKSKIVDMKELMDYEKLMRGLRLTEWDKAYIFIQWKVVEN